MTEKLGHLGVVVESGSVISRIEVNKNYEDRMKVRLLQPKALTGKINDELLDEIFVDASAYCAGKIKTTATGDVVMKLTTPYDVGYVHEDQCGLVVSSHCVILRVTDDIRIDAKFLAYLLSSPYAKDYFQSETSGAATVMLKVRDIAGFPIPVLPLEEQKYLGEIFMRFSRKKQILSQMIEAEDAAENALIMGALEGRL